jgi:hypothetical protein
MTTHLVFCSACDRNVTLAPRTSAKLWRIVLTTQPLVELQCLDQGVICTGSLCPYAADDLPAGDLEEGRAGGVPAV